MPQDLDSKLEELLSQRSYKNRSEAIRDLIRQALIEEEWKLGKGKMTGVLILVYSHSPLLSDKLIAFEHKFFRQIISTLHIHLDEENCLEVLVMKGEAVQIQEISNQLIATKGVKEGKLIPISPVP